MNFQPIEASIGFGDIEGAMTALIPVTRNTPNAQTILLLQSRHSRMRADIQKGIVTGEEARTEMNKIAASLTEIVEQLKKKQDGGDNSVTGNTFTVTGSNNHIIVGVNDSTINHSTQNHYGSGDNVQGGKTVSQ
jgi:Effector-associated domain 11